jgi:hypothetical protein
MNLIVVVPVACFILGALLPVAWPTQFGFTKRN